MSLQYHYIVLNYRDNKGWKMDNPNGYYSICIEDLYNQENITVVNYPLECKPLFLRLIYRFFLSLKSHFQNCRIIKLIIRFFYPLYLPICEKNGKYCFVFISDIWDIQFMKYLKKKYPESKIVMALRDLVKTKRFYKELLEANLVDYWMSYDKGDCEEYNMFYFSEFESKIEISTDSNVPSSDVFFTGRAKQRLPKLIECYDYLTSLGLKCLFIILDAPEEQKQKRDGIVYTNQYMTYRRMLEYSIRSKCLLDINQEGATGYTSRFLEAVIYNKLLLTNTRGIEKHPLYDSRYIKEFQSIDEVPSSFFENKDDIKYNYKNEFSPLNFIRRVDEVVSQVDE